MREKVHVYITKPNKKLFNQLTTMEQKWVLAKAENGKADIAADKKPK